MASPTKSRRAGRRHPTTWSRRCTRRAREVTKLVRALSELGAAILVLMGLVAAVGLELTELSSRVCELIGR